MSTLIEVNQATNFPVQLFDGDATMFVRVRVYLNGVEQTTAPWNSPISLTHVANGLYRTSITPTTEGVYTLQAIVYSDAAFTTLARKYSISSEVWTVRSVDQDLATLLSRLTSTRAGLIDNLDATISSREAESAASSRQSALIAEHDATQATLNTKASQESVDSIQNNTTFHATVPVIFERPETGTLPWKILVSLFDTQGSPQDPDSNIMNLRLETGTGTVIVPTTAMTRTATGAYELVINIASTHTLGQYIFYFEYAVGAISFRQVRAYALVKNAVAIEDIDAGIDTVLARIGTPAVTVSADIATRASQASISALNNLSQAGVQSALTSQGYTVARSASLDLLDIAVSTRSTQTSVTAVKSVVDAIVIDTGTDIPAQIDALNDPSASAIADAVWDEAIAPHQLAGTFGENLDAAISSRATQTSVDNIQNNTNFQAILPAQVQRPPTGDPSVFVTIFARLFDNLGAPKDPDLNQMYIKVQSQSGFVAVASTLMTRTGVGAFEYVYEINDTSPLGQHVVFFDYDEGGVAKEQVRSSQVSEVSGTLDQVALDTAAIKLKTDVLTFDSGRVCAKSEVVTDKTGYALTSGDKDAIVDKVWSEPQANHNTLGTFGELANIQPYFGAIHIDTITGTFGTTVGFHGTPSHPCKNLADALILAQSIGLFKLQLAQGVLTLTQNLEHFEVFMNNSAQILLGGFSVEGTKFIQGKISGAMAGRIYADRTILDGVEMLLGEFFECGLDNTNKLAIGNSNFHDCFDNSSASGAAILDFVGAGRDISVRNYSGGLIVENLVAGSETVLNLATGRIVLQPTCSGGTVVVRGIGSLIDNSTGTSVNKVSLINNLTIADANWDEAAADHVVAGSMGEKASRLDVTISSRESEASAAARAANLTAEHLATQANINSLNDLSTSDVQAAMTNQGYTTTRAPKLDNLDATVSSRESESSASTRHSTDVSEHNATQIDIAAVQSSVSAIQNNTNFVGVVPPVLIMDQASSKTYKFYANLFDAGVPVDPTANAMNISVKKYDGTVLISTTTMTRTGAGKYEYSYVVDAGAVEQGLVVLFSYTKNSVAYEQVRTTEVQEFESKIDTVLSRLTSTRALKLDLIDVAISSRESESSAASRQATDLAQHSATQSQLTLVGSNVVSIKGKTDQLNFNGTLVRAQADTVLDKSGYALSSTAQFDIVNKVWDELKASHAVAGSFGAFLDAAISSRESEANASTRATTDQIEHDNTQAQVAGFSSDLSAVKAKTDQLAFTGGHVQSRSEVVVDKTGYALSSAQILAIADQIWDELLSGHTTAGSAGQYLTASGAPPSPAVIAQAVWDELRAGRTLTGSFGQALQGVITAARANALDNLDVAISTRGTQADLSAVKAKTDQLGFTSGNVQAAVDKTGYALTSADKDDIKDRILNPTIVGYLENLDATVSSRADQATVDAIDTATDDLETRLSATRAANLDNLDAAISTRSTPADIPSAGDIATAIGTVTASVDEAAVAEAVWDEARAAALIADVATKSSQASVDDIPTNPVLDNDSRLNNLDAAVSSRASQASVESINSEVSTAPDLSGVVGEEDAVEGTVQEGEEA